MPGSTIRMSRLLMSF